MRAMIILLIMTAPAGAWCKASWYGPGFEGKPMACGGTFDSRKPTAAHPSFPCGTTLWVRSREGKSVRVTITDRGPFKKGRCIDLSAYAFSLIAPKGKGIIDIEWRPTLLP